MGLLNSSRSRVSLVAAGLAMTFANISPLAASADHKLFLPVGTVIPVKLDKTLSSKYSQPGDKFSATVKEGRDDAGLPYGTRIEGVVRESIPAGDGKPGVLDVDFRRIVIPGNESRAIDGTLYTLNGKDVKRKDGRLVATADKGKDRLKWVGIGAGAGLILGTLTKGNALFDTILGAGAGYLYNELQNKKPGDVNLKENTEFGVRLEKMVTFNVDDRTYERFQGRGGSDRYQDEKYYDERDRRNDDRRNDDRRNDDRRNDDRYYRRGDTDPDRFQNSDYRGNDIGVVIDSREVRFSQAKPFMRNGIVFVPVEPVSKSFDAGYRYDANDRIIRARDGKVRNSVGSRVVFVDGERRIMPAASELKEGVIYVPSQFLGWFVNGSTTWDKDSKTVIVTTDRDRDR